MYKKIIIIVLNEDFKMQSRLQSTPFFSDSFFEDKKDEKEEKDSKSSFPKITKDQFLSDMYGSKSPIYYDHKIPLKTFRGDGKASPPIPPSENYKMMMAQIETVLKGIQNCLEEDFKAFNPLPIKNFTQFSSNILGNLFKEKDLKDWYIQGKEALEHWFYSLRYSAMSLQQKYMMCKELLNVIIYCASGVLSNMLTTNGKFNHKASDIYKEVWEEAHRQEALKFLHDEKYLEEKKRNIELHSVNKVLTHIGKEYKIPKMLDSSASNMPVPETTLKKYKDYLDTEGYLILYQSTMNILFLKYKTLLHHVTSIETASFFMDQLHLLGSDAKVHFHEESGLADFITTSPGYHYVPLSSEDTLEEQPLKENYFYLKKTETGIEFLVLNLEGKGVSGNISIEELELTEKEFKQWNKENTTQKIMDISTRILNITTGRGHTRTHQSLEDSIVNKRLEQSIFMRLLRAGLLYEENFTPLKLENNSCDLIYATDFSKINLTKIKENAFILVEPLIEFAVITQYPTPRNLKTLFKDKTGEVRAYVKHGSTIYFVKKDKNYPNFSIIPIKKQDILTTEIQGRKIQDYDKEIRFILSKEDALKLSKLSENSCFQFFYYSPREGKDLQKIHLPTNVIERIKKEFCFNDAPTTEEEQLASSKTLIYTSLSEEERLFQELGLHHNQIIYANLLFPQYSIIKTPSKPREKGTQLLTHYLEEQDEKQQHSILTKMLVELKKSESVNFMVSLLPSFKPNTLLFLMDVLFNPAKKIPILEFCFRTRSLSILKSLLQAGLLKTLGDEIIPDHFLEKLIRNHYEIDMIVLLIQNNFPIENPKELTSLINTALNPAIVGYNQSIALALVGQLETKNFRALIDVGNTARKNQQFKTYLYCTSIVKSKKYDEAYSFLQDTLVDSKAAIEPRRRSLKEGVSFKTYIPKERISYLGKLLDSAPNLPTDLLEGFLEKNNLSGLLPDSFYTLTMTQINSSPRLKRTINILRQYTGIQEIMKAFHMRALNAIEILVHFGDVNTAQNALILSFNQLFDDKKRTELTCLLLKKGASFNMYSPSTGLHAFGGSFLQIQKYASNQSHLFLVFL